MHKDIRKILRMERKVQRSRIAEVNRALKDAGHPERLRRGKGYYYFSDGAATEWRESAVYVNRAESLSTEQWLAERERLAAL